VSNLSGFPIRHRGTPVVSGREARGGCHEIHAYVHLVPRHKDSRRGHRQVQKTGGLPPKGATLLGRWTHADFSAGYDLLESDDPQALAEFAMMWSDVMQIKIYPVLEDAALGEVLQRVGG
jgi:hypothetical protein